MGPGGIDPSNRNGPRRDLAAQVALARQTLQNARSAVDMAVAALPDFEEMATATLLLLLSSSVRAMRDLSELEAQLAGQTAGGIKT